MPDLDLITSTTEALPRLIERAAAALSSAVTAAEVLDAQSKAGVAYTIAKAQVRLEKAREAHNTVIAACHKAMGDALEIDSVAKCRLADEYDKAQANGEVQGHGGQLPKRDIPNENIPSTVKDVGLTSKQVHEARTVRDAERKKPGVVKDAISAKLKAGKEPTRADVKGAVKKTVSPPKIESKTTAVKTSPPAKSAEIEDDEVSLPKVQQARQIVRPLLQKGVEISATDLGKLHNIGRRTFDAAIMLERERFTVLDELGVSRDSLKPTAQQKLDLMAQRQRIELMKDFEKRVRDEVNARLAMRDQSDAEIIQQANVLLENKSGRMGKLPFTAYEYTKVLLRALHPDTSTPEARIEAFKLVNGKKLILREEGRIITLSSQAKPLPKTPEEWAAAKAAATAERKAKRNGVSPPP